MTLHLVAVKKKKKTTVKKYSTISIGCGFKFPLNSFLSSFWLHPCFLLAFHVWICIHLFGRYNLPFLPIPHPFGSHSYFVSPQQLMMTLFSGFRGFLPFKKKKELSLITPCQCVLIASIDSQHLTTWSYCSRVGFDVSF